MIRSKEISPLGVGIHFAPPLFDIVDEMKGHVGGGSGLAGHSGQWGSVKAEVVHVSYMLYAIYVQERLLDMCA
jgi:hypothetical protein